MRNSQRISRSKSRPNYSAKQKVDHQPRSFWLRYFKFLDILDSEALRLHLFASKGERLVAQSFKIFRRKSCKIKALYNWYIRNDCCTCNLLFSPVKSGGWFWHCTISWFHVSSSSIVSSTIHIFGRNLDADHLIQGGSLSSKFYRSSLLTISRHH